MLLLTIYVTSPDLLPTACWDLQTCLFLAARFTIFWSIISSNILFNVVLPCGSRPNVLNRNALDLYWYSNRFSSRAWRSADLIWGFAFSSCDCCVCRHQSKKSQGQHKARLQNINTIYRKLCFNSFRIGIAGRSFADTHDGVEMLRRGRHLRALPSAISACRYAGLPLFADRSIKVEDLRLPNKYGENIAEVLLTLPVRAHIPSAHTSDNVLSACWLWGWGSGLKC